MSETKICPQCGTRYGEDHRFCTLDGAALVAIAPRSDLVGAVIADRYLITARLGDGGMGQVYLAEHVRMKRKCAVKVMRPGLMNDPDAISRFNREAENASQVVHQNVAAVYDFGETADGLIYLAMEYVEGESLARVLEREKAVHPVRAAEIVRQAAEALEVAHSIGILHRDLKPENIMISRTREHLDMVKIVDFGIARAMSSESQRVTRTGSMVGTPEFMSPEQFAGDTLDARSDLYSLALVAFHMLTGAPAYPSGTSKDNLIIRLTQPPRRLHDMKELPWPDELQGTFDKALASDPRMRHENVIEFSREMTAAIASMPASQTGEIYLSALAGALAARASATPARAFTPAGVTDAIPSPDAAGAAAEPKRTPTRLSPGLAAAAVIVLALIGVFVVRQVIKPGVAPASSSAAAGATDSAALVAAAESLSLTGDAPGATGAATVDEVFNRARTGVFTVMSSHGTGLGFLADSSGLIITPAYLVAGDSAVSVQTDDATRVRARIVLADAAHPVAVLAIAPRRCNRCSVLPLAGDEGGRSISVGDAIVAVGGARPARQRMLRGTVSALSPTAVQTTARAAESESGAPLLTMSGAVIGMSNTGAAGAVAVRGSAASGGGRAGARGTPAREVHVAAMRSALAAARQLVAAGKTRPPSDSLLPVRPTTAFPPAPVAAVAAIADDDLMKKYLADGGNFRVFVMTPPVMAWRDARAKDALAKLNSTPAGAALSLMRMDPIQGWSGWDPCIRARCALVAINVVPDRTPFLFHRVGVVDFSRGNVRSITLLRDGVPVEAIETAYFPAVLNVAEHVAAQKPVFSQGVALYRAREFAPKPTGGMARFELSIVDAARPDRPVRIALPPALAQTIINDFAPYGLTR